MSYIIVQGPVVKCGQCGSTSHEHVTRGNMQFERCVSCGHEGEKTEIVPTYKPSSGVVFSKLSEQASKERTF